MDIYCPNCGTFVGGNPFFIIAGQCMCHSCGYIVDLTNYVSNPDHAYENQEEGGDADGPHY